MNRIAKRVPVLSQKNPGLDMDEKVVPIFLRAIDEFRKRRRFHRFVKVKPFIEYLSSVARKKDFYKFCEELEDFRCNVLGMNETRFYKLVAEFLLVPNGRAYYNPNHLFGCQGSYEAEEFRTRIFETMAFISFSVSLDDNEAEILEFIDELTALRGSVDASNVSYKSKDWFCVESIRSTILNKGWIIEEGLQKIKTYYRMRIKKVYPEMLLNDLTKGEFDHLNGKKLEKKGKTTINEIIQNEKWE